jgi:two-component system CheB/CheR fusion protein
MRGEPVRLLLIDDNVELAEATAEYLTMAGVDVRVAEDGKGALETAEASSPDIVLCDLFLADLSGLDLAQAFRWNPHTKNVVFALYTALSEGELRALEREAGSYVDLFVSKPLTEEKLKTLLDRILA